MKKLAALLLSFSVSANDVSIDVGQTSALPATNILKSNTDSYLSVINVPTLYDESNRVAKGSQTVDFYLHDNAPVSVNVGGNIIAPGETKSLKLSTNTAGGLDIPINSNALGVVGSALFTLTINEVKALSCPSGYDLSGEMCYYTVTYSPHSYECPANYTERGSTCTRMASWVEDPNATCPSGYDYYHSYQCIDSTRYSSTYENCRSDGGMWHSWTGEGICHFNSPYILQRERMCSTGLVENGTCFDASDTVAPTPNCGGGYYNGYECSETYSTPAT